MNEEIDHEYKNSQRYADAGADQMTFEQYQELKQEAHWDIAWQIFDEVNRDNDQDRFIDLNCLELDDALAITKQKLFDVAQSKAEQYNSHSSFSKDSVLSILTSKNHLVPTSNGKSLQNEIVEMIGNELELDLHYIGINKIILVRINHTTIDNPVLKEW